MSDSSNENPPPPPRLCPTLFGSGFTLGRSLPQSPSANNLFPSLDQYRASFVTNIEIVLVMKKAEIGALQRHTKRKKTLFGLLATQRRERKRERESLVTKISGTHQRDANYFHGRNFLPVFVHRSNVTNQIMQSVVSTKQTLVSSS